MRNESGSVGALTRLQGSFGEVFYYRLSALSEAADALDRLPYTVRVLLENLLRQSEEGAADRRDVLELAQWSPRTADDGEFPFMPARVLAQDFTGVPAVVDLAAMRSALHRAGGDPTLINPLIPVDLVIDHSVQADQYGSGAACGANVAKEYQRNRERYALLRWAQQAFGNFRVVPPGTGIVHQVNLEYLATVVHTCTRNEDGRVLAFPDTVVGTDSHTTMVNGLGVLGWGVGGIEAEAALLGQPFALLTPRVVGVRIVGELRPSAVATDAVLTLTQMLRKIGVVGKFVEFTGPGVSRLSLADRATLSNMAPEYGATAALFPVDAETLDYLRLTGRGASLVDLVERYTKEQGLFRTEGAPEPSFSELVDLDLSAVEPSLAGPRRPHDRVTIPALKPALHAAFPSQFAAPAAEDQATASDSSGDGVTHGSVAIAAITSCTNTSNPAVMLGAGLLAKKAVERGLRVKPHVKTTLSPGSRTVTAYLRRAGLLPYMEALGFHLVGYGCMTCIGNSGPLPAEVARQVRNQNLVVAAVLSGNRNFEGRIHPQVKASYLASPPLVVAYALAGTVDIDLASEPVGTDESGNPIYLKDIWPSPDAVRNAIEGSLTSDLYADAYVDVFAGDDEWKTLPVPAGELFRWDADSTYVQEPPFFDGWSAETTSIGDIVGARALAFFGDSITTDHISPAGSIPSDGPAGRYLDDRGVSRDGFNSFGARRGNHEVMMRGTFGNIRLRNQLVPEREGGWTVHLPDGEVMSIFDASLRYREEGVPLILLAGKEYGSGSSRDWAAKGPMLLGVRAVLAQSFERIHRSNLVAMGILPLEYKTGDSATALGLTGRERFDILGIQGGLTPGQDVTVRVWRDDGSENTFTAVARIDSASEVEYYRHRGVLPMVLRRLLAAGRSDKS